MDNILNFVLGSKISDWANVLGGIAGLSSAFFVAYEKITAKPKVLSNVTQLQLSIVKENPLEELNLIYAFTFNIEVGNVGNLLTTILNTHLILPNGSPYECYYPEDGKILERKTSLVLAPGFAGTYKIYTRCLVKGRIQNEIIECELVHKLIGGKEIRNKLRFSEEVKTP